MPCMGITDFIQTEASRRRRKAGFQQGMENGLGSGLYVCMFFADISRSKVLCEAKVVPCCSPAISALLRHGVIRVRFLMSAPQLKIAK